PDDFTPRRAFQNQLDRKVAGLTSTANGQSYTGGLLAFDFDHPNGMLNSLGDGLQNPDETLLGSGSSAANALNLEGSTVQGDSGGPLFVRDTDGIWKVAGVLSGGADEPIIDHPDGSYGDISIYIRVATARDWIAEVIE
ncbi:MAG: trypsin-like serine protease, partial [Bacteroidota bacterium]